MTARLRKLWPALERVPAQAAVAAEWRAHMGDEFDLVRDLFRPDATLATSYPCPQRYPCECGAHEVIEYGSDDWVAACRCFDECDTVQVTRDDIVLWRLDRKKLGVAVASALGADPEWNEVDGLPMAWRVGTYAPVAGYRFPVYLTIQIEDREFQRSLEGLAARSDEPFILVAPTHEPVKPTSEALLERRNAGFVALSDLLVVDGHGGLAPAPGAGHLFYPFLRRCGLAVSAEKSAAPAPEVYCRVITHEGERSLDRKMYQSLVDTASGFGLYIDGVTRTVIRKGDADVSPPVTLSPGEFDIIAEYIISRKPMRPSRTRIGSESTPESAQRTFRKARGKVDISVGRNKYQSFRMHKTVEAGMQSYEFSPPDDLTYCLILPAHP